MSSTLNQIIGIQPLKIRFITNVNDNQPILFTRDKIHLETNENDDEEAFAATLSEYPFFTDQVFIPANQLIKLSKKKQINTLFNKNEFRKLISTLSAPTTNIDERNVNAKNNLDTIINVLLPTSFPIRSNIHKTFSENIKNSNSDATLDSGDDIFSLFQQLIGNDDLDFGYLSNNGIYTVTKITIINDIINDPLFKELIVSGNNFQNWRTKKIEEFTKVQNNLTQKIKVNLNNNFDNFKSDIQDPSTNLGSTWKDIQNKTHGLNRQASTPRTLMVPYIKALLVLNKDTDFDKIIEQLIMIAGLTKSSSSRADFLPPILQGYGNDPKLTFGVLVENAYDYKINNEILSSISNINIANNIIKKGKIKKPTKETEKAVFDKISSFKEIESFLKIIKRFKPPVRNYSNKNINQIFEQIGTNIDAFTQLIGFINKVNKDERPESKLLNNATMLDNLETGIMTLSEKVNFGNKDENILNEEINQYYDTLIHLECIKGIVNNDNVEKIKCPYRNEYLTSLYDELREDKNKNPLLFYSDFEVIDMGDLLNENKTENSDTTDTTNEPVKTQAGGYPAKRKKKIGGYPANYTIYQTINSRKGKKKTKGKRRPGKKRKYLTLRNIHSKSQSKKD